MMTRLLVGLIVGVGSTSLGAQSLTPGVWIHPGAWRVDTLRPGLLVEGPAARQITERLLERSPTVRRVVERILTSPGPRWTVRITERPHHPETDAPLAGQSLETPAMMLWPSALDDLRREPQWRQALIPTPGRLVIRPVPGGAELLIEIHPTAEFAWATAEGMDLEPLRREWGAILGHELAGHGDGLWRFYQLREGDKCPDPMPGRDGRCILAAENRVRAELGLPSRRTYAHGDDGFPTRASILRQMEARLAPTVPWCWSGGPRAGAVCVVASR